MLPASNRGMGQSLNFPDVCKTPAPPAPFVPVPYPNLGMNMQAAPFSPFVSVAFVPATNQGSMKVMTSGDEAGAMGGLITGAIKAPGRTTIGNPIVFVTGLPGNCLATPTSGNNMNAPVGAQIVPSQPIVSYTRKFVGPGDEAAQPQPLSMEQVQFLEQQTQPAESTKGAVEAVRALRLGPRRSYLRVERFTTHCDREVYNALRLIGHEASDGLVVDLRQNGGGDAAACLRLAGQFVEAGTHLLDFREADGDVEELRSRSQARYLGPVVVVLDEDSASASELFAAAMKANHRVRVVGQVSYGKGSAQQVRCDEQGRWVYGTIGEFCYPAGGPIEGVGVVPDWQVEAQVELEELDTFLREELHVAQDDHGV